MTIFLIIFHPKQGDDKATKTQSVTKSERIWENVEREDNKKNKTKQDYTHFIL